MNNISTIIVVKGYPIHIKEVIASIEKMSGEILIADIGIDEKLLKDLKKIKKVKVHTIKQAVPYVELIRDEFNKKAKYDHILLLDPDEVVPSTLIDELEQHLDADYCLIPRKNIIFGKWIQHSRWFPDYQVRFFKKNKVKWPTKIHQQPQLLGTGVTLDATESNSLIHYNYESIDEYMMKAIRYAKAEASESYTSQGYTLKEAITRGISEFISRFFADEGFKDGMHGFVLAFLQMVYSFLVYFYVWELKKYPTQKMSTIIESADFYFSQGMYETQHWILRTIPPAKKVQYLKMKVMQRIFK